jgi:hypothetical protein
MLSCRMPYLGKLKKLLIQHDNSGDNPAWHLFKVGGGGSEEEVFRVSLEATRPAGLLESLIIQ